MAASRHLSGRAGRLGVSMAAAGAAAAAAAVGTVAGSCSYCDRYIHVDLLIVPAFADAHAARQWGADHPPPAARAPAAAAAAAPASTGAAHCTSMPAGVRTAPTSRRWLIESRVTSSSGLRESRGLASLAVGARCALPPPPFPTSRHTLHPTVRVWPASCSACPGFSLRSGCERMGSMAAAGATASYRSTARLSNAHTH